MATNNGLNLGLSGSTGSGSFVGSEAPTVVNGIWQNPTLISGGGDVFTVSNSGIPVNQFVMTGVEAGNAPVLSAEGTDTDILLQLSGKGTSGVGIEGTSTNDNAVAGNVGQYIDNIILSGSAVSLTSTVAANVTSIELGAGDWDVGGEVTIAGTATTAGVFRAGVTQTSATIPVTRTSSTAVGGNRAAGDFAAIGDGFITTGQARLSLSGTTTVYLVASASFSGGTATAYGKIYARRVR